MPRPRIYKDNAARQKAYRERVKKGETTPQGGTQAVVRRVMAAERRASE